MCNQGDIQRRWSEGETAQEEAINSSVVAAFQVPAEPTPEERAPNAEINPPVESSIPASLTATDVTTTITNTITTSTDHSAATTTCPTPTPAAVVTVTTEPVCPIIPPPSVVEAAHQSGHVIRLHVKSIFLYNDPFNIR